MQFNQDVLNHENNTLNFISFLWQFDTSVHMLVCCTVETKIKWTTKTAVVEACFPVESDLARYADDNKMASPVEKCDTFCIPPCIYEDRKQRYFSRTCTTISFSGSFHQKWYCVKNRNYLISPQIASSVNALRTIEGRR